MEITGQIWRDVPGYEGIYMVSDFGSVKSVDHRVLNINGLTRIQKGRMLRTSITKKGYVQVSLSKNGRQFHTGRHRLAALAFIPNPKNLPQVNHIDGNKLNNRVDNLEWCDNQYNCAHAEKSGLVKRNYGEKHHMAKLTNKESIELRELLFNGATLKSMSERFGLSTTAISNIKRGKTYNQSKI